MSTEATWQVNDNIWVGDLSGWRAARVLLCLPNTRFMLVMWWDDHTETWIEQSREIHSEEYHSKWMLVQ